MRVMRIIVLTAVLAGLCVSVNPVSADSADLVKNGSFEGEYIYGVAADWTAFNNGLARFTYGPDSWSKTVYDGKYSQLLGIYADSGTSTSKDRYTGIYQVVDVVPGQRYMFAFYGMARSTEGDESASKWNYRIEVGFDDAGGTSPWDVTDWTEMPWPEYGRKTPGLIQSYAHGVDAESDKLTIFIRCHKKFANLGTEADFNIDAVSLTGAKPTTSQAQASPAVPAASTTPTIPKTGAGDVLPILGFGLAATAMGLTGRRLLRRNS